MIGPFRTRPKDNWDWVKTSTTHMTLSFCCFDTHGTLEKTIDLVLPSTKSAQTQLKTTPYVMCPGGCTILTKCLVASQTGIITQFGYALTLCSFYLCLENKKSTIFSNIHLVYVICVSVLFLRQKGKYGRCKVCKESPLM